MRYLSVSSIKVALLLSFSFTVTPWEFPSKQPFRFSSPPKATVSDLLTLLGPTYQVSKLDPREARDLWSCLKFLVPFKNYETSVKRRSTLAVIGQRTESEENDLIWWPPKSVLELARLSVDSGGDPDVIYRALDPTIIPVPDVEGSKECKCELTRYPYGWHFIYEELSAYLVFLFELIASRGPSVGIECLIESL